MRSRFRLPALIMLLSLGTASCRDSPTGITSPVGTFMATRFTIIDNAGTHDLLPDGARLDLTLEADGTVSGALVVPDATDPIIASMAGTWTRQGDALTFSQDADTFVRDTHFVLKSNSSIEADQVFAGTRVLVTLTRQ